MGFIAEFTLHTPLMQATMEAVSDALLQVEDLQLPENGSAKLVFWTNDLDFDQLNTALDADPTIQDFILLAEVGDRRLYRVSFTEEAKQRMTYPAAAEFDIVFLDVTITDEGSRIRAQVPAREALKAYRDACQEKDISFRLNRLYRENQNNPPERYGLTDRQWEALRLTYERGYFDTERAVTLEDIAGELDITRQALASRLRRGHKRLLSNTLFEGPL